MEGRTHILIEITRKKYVLPGTASEIPLGDKKFFFCNFEKPIILMMIGADKCQVSRFLVA